MPWAHSDIVGVLIEPAMSEGVWSQSVWPHLPVPEMDAFQPY